MNKDKLKALCHKLSKESGLPFNMKLQTHYLTDTRQISSSCECEKFLYLKVVFYYQMLLVCSVKYIRY